MQEVVAAANAHRAEVARTLDALPEQPGWLASTVRSAEAGAARSGKHLPGDVVRSWTVVGIHERTDPGEPAGAPPCTNIQERDGLFRSRCRALLGRDRAVPSAVQNLGAGSFDRVSPPPDCS